MTKQCKHCNKEFLRKPKYSDKQWGLSMFCSISCASTFNKLGFKAGHIVSEETRSKIGLGNSVSLLGNIPWNKGIKSWVKPWLGKTRSEETKQKISINRKGKLMGDDNPKAMLGKHHTLEARKRIGDGNRGDKCHFWKGGISTYKRKVYLNHRRRILKLNADGFHLEEEWKLLKEQYNFTCPSCYKKEPDIVLTVDHILPLSKGGSDYISNIQPLCKSCNSSKSTKEIKFGIYA